MKMKLAFVSAAVVAFSIQSAAFAAEPTAEAKAAAANIDSACAQDATTAGCSEKGMGKGLMKCLKKHKKENKSFQLSSGCKAAIEESGNKKAGK